MIQSSQKQGASMLSLVKTQESFNLIIPEEVERKIRYLCSKIPNVEWSGTLFYDYRGNWEDKSLEIICKDIYVMDIGSTGYTEFDVNPDVVAYMCDHEELMEYQTGLIHSHNHMSTFFSSTDTATLQEEGSKRNHFVSLIVNNAGVYTAGITKRVTSTKQVTESYSFGTFNDDTVEGEALYTRETERIEWCNLNIQKPEGYSFQELDSRLDEIKKGKINIPKAPLYKSSPIATAAFDDWKYKNQPTLFDYSPEATKDLNINISSKYIRSTLLQLITGSVAISDESRIDLNKWATGMERIFDKRFEGSLEYYKAWAEGFCEFVILYPPKEYEGEDENLFAETLAFALIEELDKLPKNKYIKTLKETLEAWIV